MAKMAFTTMVRRRLAVATLALLVPATLAAQEKNGDPEKGVMLARSWCSSCHVVEAKGRGADTAPPFAEIANDPKRSPAALRAWLARPHPPMPNMNLSRTEIDDIVAYLQSLKTAH